MAQIVLDGGFRRGQPQGQKRVSAICPSGGFAVRERDLPLPRRCRRRAYYWLARSVLLAIRKLPARLGQAMCRNLTKMALHLCSRDRQRALANIGTAFPELDDRGRSDLLRQATEVFGRNLFQTLMLPDEIKSQLAQVRDDGALERLIRLSRSGRGVLVLTGHLGCWELLGAYLAHGLGRFGVVTGTIHNERVDALIQSRRVGLGMTVLPRRSGVRPVIRLLRDGGVVAVLLDQRTRAHNLEVPFFGRPAPTASGIARLALRYDIPVLPVCIGRDGNGHLVRHLPPIEPPETDAPERVRAFLGRCNDALETMIRRNPAEWVWFHERWGDGTPAGNTTSR